jgi:hypothetical protein
VPPPETGTGLLIGIHTSLFLLFRIAMAIAADTPAGVRKRCGRAAVQRIPSKELVMLLAVGKKAACA